MVEKPCGGDELVEGLNELRQLLVVVAGFEPATTRGPGQHDEQATDPNAAAVKCPLTDREQLTSYLRFPREHHAGSGTTTASNGPSARPAAA